MSIRGTSPKAPPFRRRRVAPRGKSPLIVLQLGNLKLHVHQATLFQVPDSLSPDRQLQSLELAITGKRRGPGFEIVSFTDHPVSLGDKVKRSSFRVKMHDSRHRFASASQSAFP